MVLITHYQVARIKLGETLEEAVIREVKEETGLHITVKEICYISEAF